MEQQSSTSKVTGAYISLRPRSVDVFADPSVEFFDPYDVYKLLAPGLIPRLPLRNLNWQSHSGPLRSIDTLHVELINGGDDGSATPSASAAPTGREDGFQTQTIGGRPASTDTIDTQSTISRPAAAQRRHQIPGLRRTPYLKVLFLRCDDNESYKGTVRSEVREWVKTHTAPTSNPSSSSSSAKKAAAAASQEKHDAFEWLIVHVVIPNTVAATQPRSSNAMKSEMATPDGGSKSTSSSRWRTGSTPLLEKLRSDFNGSSKSAPGRVAQIRIGINDVPYDLLPRVVPAVPTGYSENEQDAEQAWGELVTKLKSQILSSFDQRVTQYEEDIKEKDAQRALPGWNFCTFFILKEGLARGFESVGLVEDALVGYDELGIGLESSLQEQSQSESHAGTVLEYTEELKDAATKAVAAAFPGDDGDEEEAVDLQSKESTQDVSDDIIISSTKKAYRDMILANQVSVFDFRCYIFSRQVALLLRLANVSSSREELLAKLKEQQDSVSHGVAPLAPPPVKQDEAENLGMLAEICRRTLAFVPSVSQIMRRDIFQAIAQDKQTAQIPDLALSETIDNMVATFAFSVAQQILAQTSTKALPIPPSSLGSDDVVEPKSAIPEPKTMMHPARSSSLHIRSAIPEPPSPGHFPGPGRRASVSEAATNTNAHFLKAGLEDLAAKRAELYMLSRSILDGLGKRRGWDNGWEAAPLMDDPGISEMEDISLDDDDDTTARTPITLSPETASTAGIANQLLRTAVDNSDDFYRLYEILTDKSLRHYTVANHQYAVHGNFADLAVLKLYMKEYRAAAAAFVRATPFFGAGGWSLLELSMLVMYTQCLSELQSQDDYVTVALKLLTKACLVEGERLQHKSSILLSGEKKHLPDLTPLQGVVERLFELAEDLPSEVKVPLSNLFTNIQVEGTPIYHDGKDSCSVAIALWNLMPANITVERVALKATCVDNGPCSELLFESSSEMTLTPGKNTIMVDCNVRVFSQRANPADKSSPSCPANTASTTLASGQARSTSITSVNLASQPLTRRTSSETRRSPCSSALKRSTSFWSRPNTLRSIETTLLTLSSARAGTR